MYTFGCGGCWRAVANRQPSIRTPKSTYRHGSLWSLTCQVLNIYFQFSENNTKQNKKRASYARFTCVPNVVWMFKRDEQFLFLFLLLFFYRSMRNREKRIINGDLTRQVNDRQKCMRETNERLWLDINPNPRCERETEGNYMTTYMTMRADRLQYRASQHHGIWNDNEN